MIFECRRCNSSGHTAATCPQPATDPAPDATVSALSTQEGGSHYREQKIQPVEYIHVNGIGFCEGNVIKYVTRWRFKGGLEDLKKAKHYLELLIELEEAGD